MIDIAYYFQHCHWDNPCFQMGMLWLAVFMVTGAATLYYKLEDAAAEAEQAKAAAEKQASEKKAKVTNESPRPAAIEEEDGEEDEAVAGAVDSKAAGPSSG